MTFGRKLDEPVQSWPWPTGQVSKPLDMSGWLVGRTLIPSDGIVREHGIVWRDRSYRVTGSNPSSLEERIAALEKQSE